VLSNLAGVLRCLARGPVLLPKRGAALLPGFQLDASELALLGRLRPALVPREVGRAAAKELLADWLKARRGGKKGGK
jgi:hypothetical protein